MVSHEGFTRCEWHEYEEEAQFSITFRVTRTALPRVKQTRLVRSNALTSLTTYLTKSYRSVTFNAVPFALF